MGNQASAHESAGASAAATTGGGDQGDAGAPAAVSFSRDTDAQRAEEDFWFQLVELVTPYLNSGVVFEWDKERIKQIVLAISDLDPAIYWDIRAANVYGVEDSEHIKPNFPIEIPQRLLQLDPRLARLRFRLVPARIKEGAFWEQYFEQLVLGILKYLRSGGSAPARPAERPAPAASAQHQQLSPSPQPQDPLPQDPQPQRAVAV
jgi:hypothetical protein